MKRFITLILLAVMILPVRADEGMWIPMLLGKNEAAMQKAGMKISAKDIYDINNACLKDAVMLFGGGCTGEYISAEGLVLTNHHCGYNYITKHSTVEHDYLTNGFWAMSRAEELPCPGLTVTRLVRMEDVTKAVLSGINNNTPEEERIKMVEQNIKEIAKKAVEGTHYKAVIKPFYYGNQYFMYINEIFTDVRLVGAPPSNIGKFGGDTDNWMWPRHTGDFSMFRVYVDENNKPAPYSKENKPYKPLKHLEISLNGVDEGDFTFVFGYPGTTRRYVTSDAVDLAANVENPIRIGLRDIRLKHYKEAQELSPAQRLKYASQVAGIANGWKKWQGESLGIARLKGVAQKKAQEQEFQAWARNKSLYSNVLDMMHKSHGNLKEADIKITYFNEAVMASDFMNRALVLWQLSNIDSDSNAQKLTSKWIEPNEVYFKDFAQHTVVDRAIFIETWAYMVNHLGAEKLGLKYKSEADMMEQLGKVYDESILNDGDALIKMLKNYKVKDVKKLKKDPAVELFNWAFETLYNQDIWNTYRTSQNEINRMMRTYIKGMMEMHPDSNFFPDANLTLRVTYGKVTGFHPSDAVYYKPYSTLQGIIEKENPDIYDYVVEPKLKALYNNKDYGQYANKKGELPVGFIATNHTTGGNSGSPVLNAYGQLVGINFDRCWEGTMSDLLYDPEYCRNISLDIRYCLFIIDKFAGASHLIKEMTIVK